MRIQATPDSPPHTTITTSASRTSHWYVSLYSLMNKSPSCSRRLPTRDFVDDKLWPILIRVTLPMISSYYLCRTVSWSEWKIIGSRSINPSPTWRRRVLSVFPALLEVDVDRRCHFLTMALFAWALVSAGEFFRNPLFSASLEYILTHKKMARRCDAELKNPFAGDEKNTILSYTFFQLFPRVRKDPGVQKPVNY